MRTMIKHHRNAVRRYNQPYSMLPKTKMLRSKNKPVRRLTKPGKTTSSWLISIQHQRKETYIRTMIKHDGNAVRCYNRPYSILSKILKLRCKKKSVRNMRKPGKNRHCHGRSRLINEMLLHEKKVGLQIKQFFIRRLSLLAVLVPGTCTQLLWCTCTTRNRDFHLIVQVQIPYKHLVFGKYLNT